MAQKEEKESAFGQEGDAPVDIISTPTNIIKTPKKVIKDERTPIKV